MGVRQLAMQACVDGCPGCDCLLVSIRWLGNSDLCSTCESLNYGHLLHAVEWTAGRATRWEGYLCANQGQVICNFHSIVAWVEDGKLCVRIIGYDSAYIEYSRTLLASEDNCATWNNLRLDISHLEKCANRGTSAGVSAYSGACLDAYKCIPTTCIPCNAGQVPTAATVELTGGLAPGTYVVNLNGFCDGSLQIPGSWFPFQCSDGHVLPGSLYLSVSFLADTEPPGGIIRVYLGGSKANEPYCERVFDPDPSQGYQDPVGLDVDSAQWDNVIANSVDCSQTMQLSFVRGSLFGESLPAQVHVTFTLPA